VIAFEILLIASLPHQVRIVNAGAISPLVALLGTGTIAAKEEAVLALTCLAQNDPSNQLAIATGLVALLGSGSAEAQEQVTNDGLCDPSDGPRLSLMASDGV
jgi:hypothetical protein